jgi:hypothetical protein
VEGELVLSETKRNSGPQRAELLGQVFDQREKPDRNNTSSSIRVHLTDRISAAKALRGRRRAANPTKDKARRRPQIARLWQLQMLVRRLSMRYRFA